MNSYERQQAGGEAGGELLHSFASKLNKLLLGDYAL